MRGGIVAIGVLLLVIGFVMVFNGYTEIQQHNNPKSLEPILQEILEDLRKAIENPMFSLMLGGILCIVGLFTALAGLAAKPKQKGGEA